MDDDKENESWANQILKNVALSSAFAVSSATTPLVRQSDEGISFEINRRKNKREKELLKQVKNGEEIGLELKKWVLDREKKRAEQADLLKAREIMVEGLDDYLKKTKDANLFFDEHFSLHPLNEYDFGNLKERKSWIINKHNEWETT